MSYPAGLSTDSLELNSTTPVSPSATQQREDQWSDAHDTLDTDNEQDAVEEVDNPEDLTVVQASKLPSDKTETHELDTPSPTNFGSSLAQERAAEAEATSVRSMPVVQVTEPTSPTLPATPHSVQSHRSSTTTATNTSLAPPAGSVNSDRRRRHRTTFDVSVLFPILLST